MFQVRKEKSTPLGIMTGASVSRSRSSLDCFKYTIVMHLYMACSLEHAV